MSIKIAVAKEEKYSVPTKLANNSKNVSLIYLPPTSRQLIKEVTKYQKNGKVVMTEANGIDAMLNLLDDTIVGWEGIQDDSGKKLEFKKEYVKYLPFDIQMDFINKIITPRWMNAATDVRGGTVSDVEQKKESALGN